jgi:hypothetical protein
LRARRDAKTLGDSGIGRKGYRIDQIHISQKRNLHGVSSRRNLVN